MPTSKGHFFLIGYSCLSSMHCMNKQRLALKAFESLFFMNTVWSSFFFITFHNIFYAYISLECHERSAGRHSIFSKCVHLISFILMTLFLCLAKWRHLISDLCSLDFWMKCTSKSGFLSWLHFSITIIFLGIWFTVEFLDLLNYHFRKSLDYGSS